MILAAATRSKELTHTLSVSTRSRRRSASRCAIPLTIWSTSTKKWQNALTLTANSSWNKYDDLAEEILRLRQLREQTVMDDVSKAEYQSRIKELQAFIQSQPKRLTFDDTLVKHLLAKITIFPEHLLFEFKSGVNITIEK